MAKVELDSTGQYAVTLETHEDVAAFQVALRAVDGADRVGPKKGETVRLDTENPHNAFALWLSGFAMNEATLRVILDAVAPLAWAHMGIHSRAFQRLTMRRVQEMQIPKGSKPSKGDPPGNA